MRELLKFNDEAGGHRLGDGSGPSSSKSKYNGKIISSQIFEDLKYFFIGLYGFDP